MDRLQVEVGKPASTGSALPEPVLAAADLPWMWESSLQLRLTPVTLQVAARASASDGTRNTYGACHFSYILEPVYLDAVMLCNVGIFVKTRT